MLKPAAAALLTRSPFKDDDDDNIDFSQLLIVLVMFLRNGEVLGDGTDVLTKILGVITRRDIVAIVLVFLTLKIEKY